MHDDAIGSGGGTEGSVTPFVDGAPAAFDLAGDPVLGHVRWNTLVFYRCDTADGAASVA